MEARVSRGFKGHSHSESTKHLISNKLKNQGIHPPWELSPCRHGGYTANEMFGEEVAERRRQSTIKSNKNRIVTLESRMKMAEAKMGEKNPGWKGGTKTKLQIIRNSLDIKAWRKAVLLHDNYICQKCGATKAWLQAHHIKPFAKYPELRFEVANGQTLCDKCHKETDSYGGRWQRERMVRAK